MHERERVHRRWRMDLVVGGVALLIVTGAVGAASLLANEEVPRRSARAPVVLPEQAPSLSWQSIAPSPLQPRHDAVGVWTGHEMLVVGGTTGTPCPPTADCAGPSPDTFRSDGAAYDPERDSWRRLAEAPRPVAGGIATWSGREMVVVTNRTTLAYDPQADSWRVLEAAPADDFNQSVRTDNGIIFTAYERAAGQKLVDWLLDPATGMWSPLPNDPFGESYDRSMSWDGERLWLLSMSLDSHMDAYRGAESRVAVLENGAWRVIGETPPLAYEQEWWWFQDRLVAPVAPYAPESDRGAYLMPTGLEWSSLPAVAGDEASKGCPLPSVGPGASWLAGGGPVLTSLDPVDTTAVPPCRELAEPDVAVWNDDELIVWGGIDSDYRGNVNVGLTWTAPEPS